MGDELIGGVTAHIAPDSDTLLFDGAILETGSSLTDSLSPISALPAFMDFLAEGYVKSSGSDERDGEKMTVTDLELGDGSRMTVWQHTESMEPAYATIRRGDAVDIVIKFT